MKKNRYILVVLLLVVGCIFKLISDSHTIPIYTQTKRTVKKGFRTADIEKNGEKFFLQKVLKPGFVVFDVGANVGQWSKTALKIEPQLGIYCFEPVESVCSILSKSFQNHETVQVFPLALSDQSGISEFYHYPAASELSGFENRKILGDQVVEKITVNLSTLDQFALQRQISHIDLLKIDTEGAESEILKGAGHLLDNHAVRFIQFEYGGTYFDHHKTLHEVCRFLTGKGYLIFRIFKKGLIHLSQWEESMENYRYSNYVAVRKEEFPSLACMRFE